MSAETLLFLVGSLAFTTVQTQAPETVTARLPVAKYVSVTNNAPIKKRVESIGVDVTAKSAVVVDVASGEVLFSKDSDVAYPIASLTKLVTIVTALDEKLDLDEKVAIKKEDAAGYKPIFFEGETFTRRDLLKAMLVGSSNEAANALARTSPEGYDAFIVNMRKKAREIGMRRAEFYDAAGLNPRNKASAQDIAFALKAAMANSEVRDVVGMQSVDLKNTIGPKPYRLIATNLLLTSDLNKGENKIIAAKTGTLPEAGFCFAQATREGDKTVISVVLGSETHFSRFQDVKAMTYWAFGAYEWPKQTVRKM
ncbi:MAG: serine hydrolase [Patescibacteria group bacterium]